MKSQLVYPISLIICTFETPSLHLRLIKHDSIMVLSAFQYQTIVKHTYTNDWCLAGQVVWWGCAMHFMMIAISLRCSRRWSTKQVARQVRTWSRGGCMGEIPHHWWLQMRELLWWWRHVESKIKTKLVTGIYLFLSKYIIINGLFYLLTRNS